MSFTEFCVQNAGVTPDKMDSETYIYWRIKYSESLIEQTRKEDTNHG